MAPLRAKNRDNPEFATNLPDKEERKRVRRLRVERAIAAQDKDGMDTSKNHEETAACSLSQQQVRLVLQYSDFMRDLCSQMFGVVVELVNSTEVLVPRNIEQHKTF